MDGMTRESTRGIGVVVCDGWWMCFGERRGTSSLIYLEMSTLQKRSWVGISFSAQQDTKRSLWGKAASGVDTRIPGWTAGSFWRWVSCREAATRVSWLQCRVRGYAGVGDDAEVRGDREERCFRKGNLARRMSFLVRRRWRPARFQHRGAPTPETIRVLEPAESRDELSRGQDGR